MTRRKHSAYTTVYTRRIAKDYETKKRKRHGAKTLPQHEPTPKDAVAQLVIEKPQTRGVVEAPQDETPSNEAKAPLQPSSLERPKRYLIEEF